MMRQVEQTTLFDMPEAKPVKRTISLTREAVEARVSSRKAHVKERNRFITLRYYYWTEIIRRRTDDVMSILATQEFFVNDRTIWNAIQECNDYLASLSSQRPTLRQLKAQYPSFKW